MKKYIVYAPHKCEFTSGKYTAVQKVDNFGKNYNRLLGFVPQTLHRILR